MSDDEFQRIEVITGVARRRRWSGEQKLRIVEESLQSGDTISVVARRHGVAPNLLACALGHKSCRDNRSVL